MSSPVVLYVYDLTNGMAKQLSKPLIGKQIDGVWHTSIVVYGREFYFGGGIFDDPPGKTPYGTPVQVIQMGKTQKTESEFRAFIKSKSSVYNENTYHPLTNSCNNFSGDSSMFLVEKDIPAFIRNLPDHFAETPIGKMIIPQINKIFAHTRKPFQIGSSSSTTTPVTTPTPSKTQETPPVGSSGILESFANHPHHSLKPQLGHLNHSYPLFFNLGTPSKTIQGLVDNLKNILNQTSTSTSTGTSTGATDSIETPSVTKNQGFSQAELAQFSKLEPVILQLVKVHNKYRNGLPAPKSKEWPPIPPNKLFNTFNVLDIESRYPAFDSLRYLCLHPTFSKFVLKQNVQLFELCITNISSIVSKKSEDVSFKAKFTAGMLLRALANSFTCSKYAGKVFLDPPFLKHIVGWSSILSFDPGLQKYPKLVYYALLTLYYNLSLFLPRDNSEFVNKLVQSQVRYISALLVKTTPENWAKGGSHFKSIELLYRSSMTLGHLLLFNTSVVRQHKIAIKNFLKLLKSTGIDKHAQVAHELGLLINSIPN